MHRGETAIARARPPDRPVRARATGLPTRQIERPTDRRTVKRLRFSKRPTERLTHPSFLLSLSKVRPKDLCEATLHVHDLSRITPPELHRDICLPCASMALPQAPTFTAEQALDPSAHASRAVRQSPRACGEDHVDGRLAVFESPHHRALRDDLRASRSRGSQNPCFPSGRRMKAGGLWPRSPFTLREGGRGQRGRPAPATRPRRPHWPSRTSCVGRLAREVPPAPGGQPTGLLIRLIDLIRRAR